MGFQTMTTQCPMLATSVSIVTVCIGNHRDTWQAALQEMGSSTTGSTDLYLERGSAPWLEQALQGRAGECLLVDHTGRVVASRFGPERLSHVVARELASGDFPPTAP